jgi:hypothetical protein
MRLFLSNLGNLKSCNVTTFCILGLTCKGPHKFAITKQLCDNAFK